MARRTLVASLLVASAGALSFGVAPAAVHRATVVMAGTLPPDANVPRGKVTMNAWTNLAQMRDQRVAGLSHINLAPGKCTLPLPEAIALMKTWKEEINDDPEKFALRARSDSDCPTGPDGGSLGFVTRMKLCQQFDDVIYVEKPGRVYGPITTQAGALPQPRLFAVPLRARALNANPDFVSLSCARPPPDLLAHVPRAHLQTPTLCPSPVPGLHLIFLHTCREPISGGEAILGLPFSFSDSREKEGTGNN